MDKKFEELIDLADVDSKVLQKLYDLALVASLDEMKKKIRNWVLWIATVVSIAAGLGINAFIDGQVEQVEARVKQAKEEAASIKEMRSQLERDLERVDPVVRNWIAEENNPRFWAAMNFLVEDFFNVTRVSALVTLNYAEKILGGDELSTRDFVIPFVELRGKDEGRLGYILVASHLRWPEGRPPQVNGNQITYNMDATFFSPKPISEFKIFSLLFRGTNDTAQRNQERRANAFLESGTIDLFVNGIQLISEPFGAIRLESQGNQIVVNQLLKNPLIDPAGAFEEAIMSAAAERADAL